MVRLLWAQWGDARRSHSIYDSRWPLDACRIQTLDIISEGPHLCFFLCCKSILVSDTSFLVSLCSPSLSKSWAWWAESIGHLSLFPDYHRNIICHRSNCPHDDTPSCPPTRGPKHLASAWSLITWISPPIDQRSLSAASDWSRWWSSWSSRWLMRASHITNYCDHNYAGSELVQASFNLVVSNVVLYTLLIKIECLPACFCFLYEQY